MIAYLAALSAGNAVRGLVSPAATAVAWKVLRKATAVFTGHDDPDAAVICEGETHFVDIEALQNGTPYYYRSYDQDGAGAWTAGDVAAVTVTPEASATDASESIKALVRERLELGLREEVVAGRLTHADGYIPCYTQPPIFEEMKFPAVTIHLQNADLRGGGSALGELVWTEEFLSLDDGWEVDEGALERFTLTIVGWATGNGDLRDALGIAMRKVFLANLPIFAAKGVSEPSLSRADTEDFESYGVPMFQTINTMTGVIPAAVTTRVPAIQSVTVEAKAA